MKKAIFFVLLIIFIPYLITTIFIKETNEIKFFYKSNLFVRVKRNKTGKIENVPFEDYVVGVVSGEMPTSFDIEALKSQAVAARTYVMKRMISNKKNSYDVVDTTANQVYLSYEELKNNWKDTYENRINKVKNAVYSTKGEYLTYNNEIIDATFFSTSIGITENSEDVFASNLPYLRSVDSSFEEGISPVFSVNYTFSIQEFYKKLGMTYNDNLNMKLSNVTNTGRVKKITINGKEINGSTFMWKLGLKSTYFTIKKVGSNIKITTKGFGHCVGMSQYGALALAQKGYDYDQILKHYYTDVEIKKI